jgi:hypothetical protein
LAASLRADGKPGIKTVASQAARKTEVVPTARNFSGDYAAIDACRPEQADPQAARIPATAQSAA